jgi:hypothetical protein
MKTAIAMLVLVLAGCGGNNYYYADATLLCEVEHNGKCLQWARFQRLYSVQQQLIKP